jgi:hypothetical protein
MSLVPAALGSPLLGGHPASTKVISTQFGFIKEYFQLLEDFFSLRGNNPAGWSDNSGKRFRLFVNFLSLLIGHASASKPDPVLNFHPTSGAFLRNL